jgi:formate dehydrogenase (NADP+) beta subunit
VDSLKKLLAGAVRRGVRRLGRAQGQGTRCPAARKATRNIHIGIQWLESVAFKHLDRIGERVLIIGVGNTAMDCCRSSLRLGAKDVKVMARKPRQFFKASEWELEDAEAENVEIVVNHAPKAFVTEDGRLKGMMFDRMEYDLDARGRITAERVGEAFFPADDVILAIGQENAFPWIEDDLGIQFDKWHVPVVDEKTHQSTRPDVFFGGDAAFGPKNIIWAVEHGHQAAISIHNFCMGQPVTNRLPPTLNLSSRKMGLHEWSYKNDYNPVERRLVPHVGLKERFKQISIEVELGFDGRADRGRGAALPQLRHPDGVRREALHRVRRLHRHLPDRLPHDHAQRRRAELSTRLKAPRKTPHQPLYVSEPLKQTGRVMVKDEDLCVHCGLCAERCPTAPGTCRSPRSPAPRDRPHMAQPAKAQERVNDFVIKLANVNGTGSASANTLLMKSIFRMGIPVMGKNYFPSNIQGLPTWYEIRVTRDGYVARSGAST